MKINISRKNDNARCPYCHDKLRQGIRCPICNTQYHLGCIKQIISSPKPKCATLGCMARPKYIAAKPEVNWEEIHPLIKPVFKILDYLRRILDDQTGVTWRIPHK